MVILHRVLILLAVVVGILAVIARIWHPELLGFVTPSAWLRFTNTLLLFAIALMLEQIVQAMRAKATAQS